MITNLGKKVICIKDIPSNIIEEAFFIVKTDFEHVKREKARESKKALVLSEATQLVDYYGREIELQKREEKEGVKRKKREVLILASVFVGIFVILLFLMGG